MPRLFSICEVAGVVKNKLEMTNKDTIILVTKG